MFFWYKNILVATYKTKQTNNNSFSPNKVAFQLTMCNISKYYNAASSKKHTSKSVIYGADDKQFPTG